jgi:hypothetical protein
MKPALASETPPAWVPWIPALLWLGIIALESTDLLSATHTLTLVHRVLALASGYLMSFTGRGLTLCSTSTTARKRPLNRFYQAADETQLRLGILYQLWELSIRRWMYLDVSAGGTFHHWQLTPRFAHHGGIALGVL